MRAVSSTGSNSREYLFRNCPKLKLSPSTFGPRPPRLRIAMAFSATWRCLLVFMLLALSLQAVEAIGRRGGRGRSLGTSSRFRLSLTNRAGPAALCCFCPTLCVVSMYTFSSQIASSVPHNLLYHSLILGYTTYACMPISRTLDTFSDSRFTCSLQVTTRRVSSTKRTN